MSRILIAGLGSIGCRHLKNLRELGVNDIFLFRTTAKPLKEAPDLPVFTDLSQALAAKPDAVIVSNPTAHHLDIALPAAESGCNLFIEKPLSNSWNNVEELLSVINKKQLLTVMGFDLRFDLGLCKVKSLLEESLIGRVVGVQAQVGQYLPDWHPRKDYRKSVSSQVEKGGGVILDLIHELDYLSWLLGPVSHISCFADTVSSLEIATEDTAGILLRFANGPIGTLHLDYIQREPSRSCRIIGEEGTILWDYFAKQVRWYESSKNTWDQFSYDGFERNDRFLEEMRHLLACIKGQDKPKADAFVGSEVLKLALSAKESALIGESCFITN